MTRIVIPLLFLLAAGCATKVDSPRLPQEKASIMQQSDRLEWLRAYEAHPSRWNEEDLLSIGIFYHMEGKLLDSERVLLRYLQKHPDNIVANRNLGMIYVKLNDNLRASPYFEKAYENGDTHSVGPLASTYLFTGKACLVKRLVPELRKARETEDSEVKLSVAKVLVTYVAACDASNRELFYEAIAGISDAEIVSETDLTKIVVACYEAFEDFDRLNRLRAAQDKKRR